MANTLGTNVTEVLANAGLAAFKSTLAPVRAFSLNLEDDSAQPHASVVAQLITAKSGKAFNDDYTATPDGTTTAVTVTLSTSRFTNWYVSDTEQSKTSFDVNIAFAREAAAGHALDIVTDVWGAITSGNYSNSYTAGAASTFDVDAALNAIGTLDDAKAPTENRVMVLSRTYATNLLKDMKFQFNVGSSALREGAIGRIGGVDVYMSQAVPTTGNLVGFVAHPSALAAAIRPVRPQDGSTESGLRYSEVVDAESGIRLGLRNFYDPTVGKRFGAFHSIWGKAVGQATGLTRIVSA